jgi:hypothetical protein
MQQQTSQESRAFPRCRCAGPSQTQTARVTKRRERARLRGRPADTEI